MFPELSSSVFELRDEQQFELTKLRGLVGQAPRKDLEQMLIDAITQNMVHRNVIASMTKGVLPVS